MKTITFVLFVLRKMCVEICVQYEIYSIVMELNGK